MFSYVNDTYLLHLVKGVQSNELFGGIALKNHAFFFFLHDATPIFLSLAGKYISHIKYALGRLICVAERLVTNVKVLQCLRLHEYVGASSEHINNAEYTEITHSLLNLYVVIGNYFQIYLVLWSVMQFI